MSAGNPWAEALAGRHGRDYWRAIDELLETAEFRDALRREFPAGAEMLEAGMSRRRFVQLLGASLALAGIGGCIRETEEKILPYSVHPPEVTPGDPLFYATSMVIGGYATGLLVESHAGRPTKVEGNPEHPASLGATGAYEQASVLQLYDPERARTVRHRGEPSSWGSFLDGFVAPIAAAGGDGLRLVLEPTGSPLIAALVQRLRARYPGARVYYHAALDERAAWDGAARAFGRPVQPQFDFLAADVILAADADFLAGMPFHLRYARHFADRRRISSPLGEMNRLYAIEGSPTPTGVIADHRLALPPSRVRDVLAAILAEIAPGTPGAAPTTVAPAAWVRAVARDLVANAGRSIVIVGERQPAEAHVLGHLLNAALGNVGRTVRYTDSPLLGAGEPEHDLAELVDEMRRGVARAVLVLDANPSYTAPADLEFSRWLRSVPASACLGLYYNETAADCGWFVPALHYLEAWGDGRAYDGTVSFTQPLIAPLYGGRTPAEMVATLLGDASPSAHALLRELWRERSGRDAAGFESFWEEGLHLGLLPGTESPPLAVSARAPATVPPAVEPPVEGDEPLEIAFLQDPSVYDGRFANNPWLQELPQPVSKLVWDNAAMLSPARAAALGVKTGDVVALRRAGRTLRAPVLVMPGQADALVAVALGYGRRGDEALARNIGFDAYRLRTTGAEYFARDVELERIAGEEYPLASTQTHWAMEGRPLVLSATLAEYRAQPQFTEEFRGPVPSLYEPFEYLTGDQWAMAIDLSVCTGCASCVVACQAENNVPVVGKEGVMRSREMHWLRIDRYYSGDVAYPGFVMQPMLCQHCEQAPCEYVCPVNATVHSPDGLNEMVYNRCVGTRFCSNNCPYKVRRFNWFDYHGEIAETVEMTQNPQVTVRERGVMEKCTFCVQRIRSAQREASDEGRPVTPGEVQTACQQACPTHAIAFGSYTRPDPELARRLEDPRRYAVLHELGTEPRVHYLARITNPNPALGGA